MQLTSKAVLALMLVVLAAGCTPRESRTQSARAAAVGVVAAVAREDFTEISYRYGRHVTSLGSIGLSGSLPTSFGPDPKEYTARFAKFSPESDAEIAAAVRMIAPPDETSVVVRMRWNPDKLDGDGAKAGGGWDVMSVRVEQ